MAPHASADGVALRVSVTDRCDLRCAYCMPPGGVPTLPRDQVLSFEEITRFVRAVAGGPGLARVRLTGGEPLVRRGITRLVAMLAAGGAPDLAMTTGGMRLAKAAGELRAAGLQRVNVSLDTLDPAAFRRLTGGELAPVLAGVEAALTAGLAPVKLNCVVMRSWNLHEAPDILRWGLDHGCEVRFLELMPIGCAAPMQEREFVPEAQVRQLLQRAFRMESLAEEAGSTSRRFAVTDCARGHGVVGFISPVTRPFCRGCRRIRLTSTGRVVGCLSSGVSAGVRGLLRSAAPDAEDAIRRVVAEQLGAKGDRPTYATCRHMASVGG